MQFPGFSSKDDRLLHLYQEKEYNYDEMFGLTVNFVAVSDKHGWFLDSNEDVWFNHKSNHKTWVGAIYTKQITLCRDMTSCIDDAHFHVNIKTWQWPGLAKNTLTAKGMSETSQLYIVYTGKGYQKQRLKSEKTDSSLHRLIKTGEVDSYKLYHFDARVLQSKLTALKYEPKQNASCAKTHQQLHI